MTPTIGTGALAAPFPAEGWSIFGPAVLGRSCGSCTACCTQVPVDLREVGRNRSWKHETMKPANVRCPLLSASKRCTIYANRPTPCVAWSCKWLFDPLAAGLKRPDLGGYIIDPMLDTVLANEIEVECLQIWVDPKRPDAHRAPELRAYLAAIGERYGMFSLVRWSSETGICLLPPSITGTGAFVEFQGYMMTEDDMQAKLARVRAHERITIAATAVAGSIKLQLQAPAI